VGDLCEALHQLWFSWGSIRPLWFLVVSQSFMPVGWVNWAVMLHDAHVHLTEPEYASTLPHILRLCRQVGLRSLCVSADVESSMETLKLGEAWPDLVIPFVGLHPWEVDERQLGRMGSIFEAPGVRGVGEIGLDGRASKERDGRLQVLAFKTQLEFAEKRGLPVSVHSREATRQVLEILSTYDLRGVLLHWFMGEPRELAKVQDRGYYISFGPSLLYSKRAAQLASMADRRYVLVESDGPVRYGDLFGGGPATPIAVPSVIYRLAGIWAMAYEEVEVVVEENTRAYLREG
jgi:TatD DNase family protein